MEIGSSSEPETMFKFMSVWIEFDATICCRKDSTEEIFPEELLSGMAAELCVDKKVDEVGRLLKAVIWAITKDKAIVDCEVSRKPNIYVEGETVTWEYHVKELRAIRVPSTYVIPKTHIVGKVSYIHKEFSSGVPLITVFRDFHFKDTRSDEVHESVVRASVAQNDKILIPATYLDSENLYEVPKESKNDSMKVPTNPAPPPPQPPIQKK
jgi:hypothetical protein